MKLNTAGLIFLIGAWGSVTLLTIVCFVKVMRPKKKSDRDSDLTPPS